MPFSHPKEESMENRKPETQFREDEIAFIKHFDKQRQEWVVNPHPKVGGRLRLAHEGNEALSIETDIVKYDGNTAVVSAVVSAAKGRFKGIGMASVERDKTLATAILELAETRAIARALRFAGYGVEYCSAEEVSHIENGNGGPKPEPKAIQPPQQAAKPASPNGNGNGGKPETSGKNGNGNGNGRLSAKQFKFILRLNDEAGRSREFLDEECLRMFGCGCQYLSKHDASALIESLLK
jgi:hypothetical protein